MLLLNILYSMA